MSTFKKRSKNFNTKFGGMKLLFVKSLHVPAQFVATTWYNGDGHIIAQNIEFQ